MVHLKSKISYKPSHIIPHKGSALRDGLAETLRGFILLIKQTITMKKITSFLAAFLVLVPMVSFASFDVSVKYGSRGESVEEVQDFLADGGFYTGKIDGKFGLGTFRAVKAWQSVQGLVVDGYFGRASRAKANELLADILKASDETELAETGNISSPSVPTPVIPSVPVAPVVNNTPVPNPVVNQDNTPIINPVPIPVIDPKEVPFDELGGTWDFIFTTIQEKSNALTLFLNNIYDGDIVTITFNGTTTTNVFNGKNVKSQPLLYGNYRLPETIGLKADTEYPYVLKVQRGNKYSIKTGVFKTRAEIN